MKLGASQRAQHDRAIKHRVDDPVAGTRHCRWCLTVTRSEGEYLCPQCGRWQHGKAFPDGVPGVSQAAYRCATPGCPTHEAGNALMFAFDADAPRCPTCHQPAEEV